MAEPPVPKRAYHLTVREAHGQATAFFGEEHRSVLRERHVPRTLQAAHNVGTLKIQIIGRPCLRVNAGGNRQRSNGRKKSSHFNLLGWRQDRENGSDRQRSMVLVLLPGET